jgi:tetratricopeptide (TPR) repeat protein
MGEYDTAKKIFEKTLASTCDNDARSRLYLYNILGGIAYAKSAYSTVLSYYQQILDMCPLPIDCNHFDLTDVYINMASAICNWQLSMWCDCW